MVQECPGVGVDPSLKALNALVDNLVNGTGAGRRATEDPDGVTAAHLNEHNLKALWTLSHSEAFVFLYNPTAMQPLSIDSTGRACGICIPSNYTLQDQCDGKVTASSHSCTICPIQTQLEWRRLWPDLSPAAVLAREAAAANARAAQALAEEETAQAEDYAGVNADANTSAGTRTKLLKQEQDLRQKQESGSGAQRGPVGTAHQPSNVTPPPVVNWFKRPPAVAFFKCLDKQMNGAIIAIVSVSATALHIEKNCRQFHCFLVV